MNIIGDEYNWRSLFQSERHVLLTFIEKWHGSWFRLSCIKTNIVICQRLFTTFQCMLTGKSAKSIVHDQWITCESIGRNLDYLRFYKYIDHHVSVICVLTSRQAHLMQDVYRCNWATIHEMSRHCLLQLKLQKTIWFFLPLLPSQKGLKTSNQIF